MGLRAQWLMLTNAHVNEEIRTDARLHTQSRLHDGANTNERQI